MTKQIPNKWLRSFILQNPRDNMFPFFGRLSANKNALPVRLSVAEKRVKSHLSAFMLALVQFCLNAGLQKRKVMHHFQRLSKQSFERALNPHLSQLTSVKDSFFEEVAFMEKRVQNSAVLRKSNFAVPNNEVASFDSKNRLGPDKKSFQTQKLALFHFLFAFEQIPNTLLSNQGKSVSPIRESTPFKTVLKETKKLSLLYGNLEKRHLLRSLSQAKKLPGTCENNLLLLLERRLDVTLTRARFFFSRAAAKEMIRLGYVQVNNKKVSFPGYKLVPGDIINLITPLLSESKKKLFHHSTLLKEQRDYQQLCISLQNSRNLSADLSGDLSNFVFVKANKNQEQVRKKREVKVTDFIYSLSLRLKDLFSYQDAFNFLKKIVQDQISWRFKGSPFMLLFLQNAKLYSCRQSLQFLSTKELNLLSDKSIPRILYYLIELKKQLICANYVFKIFRINKESKSLSKSVNTLKNVVSKTSFGIATLSEFKKDSNFLLEFAEHSSRSSRSRFETASSHLYERSRFLRYQTNSARFESKPLHLEISYKTRSAIFLYPTQRIHFPVLVDFKSITRQ